MTLADRLSAVARVNDPIVGQVTPVEMQAKSLLWPGEHWAAIEPVAVTSANGRRLEEYLLSPGPDMAPLPAGITTLPLSIMFDGDSARIYSAHELVAAREPILPVDDTVESAAQDGFLSRYFGRLHAADMAGTLAEFEPDGYLQHSNGHRYIGEERLRADFTAMFASNGGKIDVRFANVMDDGRIRAFECYMPNGKPAIAAYQRGASGRIAAIRICL